MNKHQIEEKLPSRLVKLKLVNFRLIAGGDLILFLGQNKVSGSSWDKSFWIESAWRISRNNKLLGGNLDNQSIMPILRNLQGKILQSVALREYGDLKICFEGEFVIETFVRSLNDEQWELREKDGVRIGLAKNLKFFKKKMKPEGSRCSGLP